MCEFCSEGPNSRQHGGDQNDLRFAGFFSAEAIEAAVQRSQAGRRGDASGTEGDGGEDDDDGT